MKSYQLFINGAFVPAESGETYTTSNPANGQPVAEVALAGKADAEKAIAAARKAFDSGVWSGMAPAKRSKIIRTAAALLKEKRKEIAALEIADSGSTAAKANADVSMSVGQLDYFGSCADRAFIEGLPQNGRFNSANYLLREPIGVCGQIIPWNFPLMMMVWKVGPALAMGNTVAIKPAAETPCSALELAALFAEAGLPEGVLNVLPAEGLPVGETLASHPDVDKVAFTGSTAVGRQVMAAAAQTVKKITLELGGKSANLVLEDADLDQAIDGALYATFFHAGQACESGTRLLLPESLHDKFLEKLVERAGKIRLGDPADRATQMGPVVSQRQFERVLGYIEKGKAEGARCVCGGGPAKLDGELANGFFIQPTIFAETKNSMQIAQEEIFGPVLSVIQYKDVDEAIAIANESIYGLGGAVWGRDIQQATQVASRIRTGTIWINDYHLLGPQFPFGGYKQSGVGREFGEAGLAEYTQLKHLHIDLGNSREKKFYYDMVIDRESKG